MDVINCDRVSELEYSNDCLHCYPATKEHFQNKADSILDYFIFKPLTFILRMLLTTRTVQSLGNSIKRILFAFSSKIKQLEFSEDIDRSQLNNALLVLWDEAKKRGLQLSNVKFCNRHTQNFVLTLNGKKYYYDSNPIYLLAQKDNEFDDASKYDDKAYLKHILFKHNLPCPLGRSFFSSKKAMYYGLALGGKLIVKPASSSLSRHVSFDIQSKQSLQNAIRLAKKIDCRVMIEQQIPGDVFRVIVIGNTLVACAKRQAATIIGNGTDTIEKLIDEKNSHPWRGKPNQRDCTLHKIEKNDQLVKLLANQNVILKTKLKKGCKILLSNKMNSGNGADIINVTALIHPENKKLFEKISKILNIPMLGLDFICKDVSIPWQKQKFAIIENNSLPYIDIHHFPSMGEPINVAEKIWDFVLNSLTSDLCRSKS